jgi:ABC-type ATPase involved in cell division
MDIRKIAVGPDYKSGAMHYIVGQSVLGNTAVIHLIKYVESEDAFKIWIESKDKKEIILWKSFLNMPVSVEYNINF